MATVARLLVLPAINTGIGAAMIQAGDVMATFVGHIDHVNDYLVSYQGLVLGYGPLLAVPPPTTTTHRWRCQSGAAQSW